MSHTIAGTDSECSSDNEQNADNEGFMFTSQYRKKMKKQQKRLNQKSNVDKNPRKPVSLLEAATVSVYKKVYIGKVNLKHSGNDIKNHLKSLNIEPKNVQELQSKSEWKSFCVEVKDSGISHAMIKAEN